SNFATTLNSRAARPCKGRCYPSRQAHPPKAQAVTAGQSMERAVSPEDREKILASATDYIESWLDGDPDRMARCLHPALAKRQSLEADASAETITRDEMIEATRDGHGKRLERPYEVSILDA